MMISENSVFIAIDGGGHMQRLVLTNRDAAILGESKVAYREGMTEHELYSRTKIFRQ